MSKRPQDTPAEEPDGGNPHIRFRGGPGRGNQPGLLNMYLLDVNVLLAMYYAKHVHYARTKRWLDDLARRTNPLLSCLTSWGPTSCRIG
jgi:hypothetical protein